MRLDNSTLFSTFANEKQTEKTTIRFPLMNKHSILLRVILLAACFVASMRMALAQDFKAYRGNIPGSYNYWFYDPQTEPDPNAHYPLLIFLHGKSLCGTDLNQVKRYGPISAVASGRVIDSYIMAPQNPGGSWNPEKVWKIVEWAKEKYPVDTTRIYVYGMSLGGYGTIDMAATYPDKIAAAVGMCGGATKKDLSGLAKLPLWIIHGTADKSVRVDASDRVVKAIKDTGDSSRLIYDRLPGVDHSTLARMFYMLITYDWLFSHSLNDPNREVNRNFVLTKDMIKDAYRDIRKKVPEVEPE